MVAIVQSVPCVLFVCSTIVSSEVHGYVGSADINTMLILTWLL